MLYSATRLDDSAVVVEQHRRLAIAPLGPARQPWEHLAHSGDEVLALDQVEGVLEVDLEQSELRVLALADDIAEGVGDDFHSSLAAHSEVPAFEVLADLFPGHHAEAFAYKALKRVTARQGRIAVSFFWRAMDTPPARMRFKNLGALPAAR